MTRILRELAEIAEYEAGPCKGDRAWMTALWRADWHAEKALAEQEEMLTIKAKNEQFCYEIGALSPKIEVAHQSANSGRPSSTSGKGTDATNR